MSFFKKLGYFAAPALVVGMGSVGLTGCEDDLPGGDICGACADPTLGEAGVSGLASLDGFFAAVGQLNNATVTASADFEGGLANLEAAFGLEAEGNLEARVNALVAEIEAEVSANASAEAGLVVKMSPAQCSANIDIAVQAQANCEAKADCTVEADPGSVEVECSGECTGSCEGSCEADASVMCEVSAGGVECEGSCEGTCELDASLNCTGTCNGDCSVECDVKNADGSCAGTCEGECNGTCEMTAGATCEGSCHGSCVVEAPEAGCEAEANVKCEGSCEGSCSGGCTGEATPPSASADCEASAECNAQASAQGSASMECTPPAISIDFAFSADANASAQASFSAKMDALKLNAGVMIASFTKYEALITGKVNGEVAFETAPILAVTDALASIELEAFGEIPVGRIDCVVGAFADSASMLGDITSESTATLKAQAAFATAFAGGFKS